MSEKMSISEYFEKKRLEKISRAKKLNEKWELLRLCLNFIEENEEWLIADRLEREYNEEKRKELWEKEMRFKKISEKRRKKLEKSTGSGIGTTLLGSVAPGLQKEKVEERNKIWNFWRSDRLENGEGKSTSIKNVKSMNANSTNLSQTNPDLIESNETDPNLKPYRTRKTSPTTTRELTRDYDKNLEQFVEDTSDKNVGNVEPSDENTDLPAGELIETYVKRRLFVTEDTTTSEVIEEMLKQVDDKNDDEDKKPTEDNIVKKMKKMFEPSDLKKNVEEVNDPKASAKLNERERDDKKDGTKICDVKKDTAMKKSCLGISPRNLGSVRKKKFKIDSPKLKKLSRISDLKKIFEQQQGIEATLHLTNISYVAGLNSDICANQP